jgi:hypothetical protein
MSDTGARTELLYKFMICLDKFCQHQPGYVKCLGGIMECCTASMDLIAYAAGNLSMDLNLGDLKRLETATAFMKKVLEGNGSNVTEEDPAEDDSLGLDLFG